MSEGAAFAVPARSYSTRRVCRLVAAIGVRVSRSNWIGCSSMQTTGWRASYGRAYTSSTSSRPAANSASASGGITQYSI